MISLAKGQNVRFAGVAAPVIVTNHWTAVGKDYDLKALVRYRDGRLVYVGAANRDEVLRTPEGAVEHGGDARAAGEVETLTINWHPDIASVAVSSYSALENGSGSFREYGVSVRLQHGPSKYEIAAADASAESTSYALCFAELVFGEGPHDITVTNLELYSRPRSEHRVGYVGSDVRMDAGPQGKPK